MEQPRTTDRERAAAYLETLFLAAGVPASRLEEVRDTLARLHGEAHLWAGIAADTHDALARLRAAGLRLGVVSNSDGRVEEALEAAGLRSYFDVVVDSALAGMEKPDPAIFRSALDVLGVAPAEALYVGDLYEVDVVGANAAGIPAVLLVTPGAAAPPACATVGSLGALADELLKERYGLMTAAPFGSGPARPLPRPIRVLVAKPGLDGHDRGAKVVAAALRDAGMEVVYTGLHQTPEMIATAAVQEDVDVVGLSILSGAHMTLFPRVRQLLDDMGRPDMLVTGGGIIPADDMEALRARGIGRLFGPGTPTSDLITYIRSWASEHLEP